MVENRNKRNKRKNKVKFSKGAMRRLRNEGIALIFFSSAILGVFLGVNAPAALIRPQVTTMFLHYNLQYRAGDIEVENTILNESLREMTAIFDRHPSWKYTIEIQSYAIERLLKEPDKFPGILERLQRQVNRGQLELICGLYSSQIINAYPVDPLLESVRITRAILEEANLSRSRVMLFQEGQFAPGLAYVLNDSDWKGVDTVIISQQQLVDFWPKWQAQPPSDVPLFVSHLGDKEMYILRYDYAPRVEGGYYHSWMYWSDAELAIEYDDRPDGMPEFSVDPDRVKNFEAHYENLEKLGNTFMTIEEWVEYNLKIGNYMDLGHYHMSTHWGPTKYNTCFTWFGDNSGNVDDGDMLADNYRGRNVLSATKILNNTYGAQLSPENQSIVNKLIESAARHMILAMVTDTTGINPNPTEREYGYSNIKTVFLNCSEAVKIFVENIPELKNTDQLQVDLATHSINLIPEKIVKDLSGTENEANLSLVDVDKLIPLSISTSTNGAPAQINGKYVKFLNQSLVELDVYFPASGVWANKSVDVSIEYSGNLEQLVYCPPLVEWMDVRVNRSDYVTEDILNIHIPLSNGLIFIPNEKDGNVGVALIHNTSQYQIAPRWQKEKLIYMTGEIAFPAPFQFFILPNTTIQTAKTLANRLNNNVTWVISPNVSQMQGFEYLEAYFSSDRGDQWSQNEWW